MNNYIDTGIENGRYSGGGALAGIRRDILYGVFTVITLAAAVGIYILGPVQRALGAEGAGAAVIAIALAGVAAPLILKRGITGSGLTPREVFQNFAVAGILASASGSQALLQVPGSLAQIFVINHLTASVAFLIYSIANAGLVSARGRHVKPVTAVMVAGTPFLFGWLLLLGNPGILRLAGGALSAGVLARYEIFTEVAGRFLVVFLFSEIVTGLIRYAAKGDFLKFGKAHLDLALISLAVVLSPYIADAGSTPAVATLPLSGQALTAVFLTMMAHAPLWGMTYLLTGMLLDGVQGTPPSQENISGNIATGLKKGMAFSGIFMAVLYGLRFFLASNIAQTLMASLPIIVGTAAGALVFPFMKTVIETFDGSKPFFLRLRYSYRNWVLYARGAVFGLGFSYGIDIGIFQLDMGSRVLFGLTVGAFSSGAVSLIRDVIYSFQGKGKIQTWKLYFFDTILGVFVGSALAFYLDTAQVPVVIEKFRDYTTAGFEGRSYVTFPLVNKWGMIDLGVYTGGVKLLYTEAFAGVLNWSVAAWLFAVNQVFMLAYFKKDKSIIRNFFSRQGAVELIKQLVRVMRWGLWMAPVIFTFLRMMPDPTWYNQDGLIRTFFATFQSLTSSPENFRAWSLNVFLYILIYDFFRILIWMDHMGLRVATLVNWSFIGLDRVDEKIARFIGPISAQKYIPEAVKRFVTWAPLLIPFYLPRGEDWEYLWTTSQAMGTAPLYRRMIEYFGSLSTGQMAVLPIFAALISTGGFSFVRVLKNRRRRKKTYTLRTGKYTLSVRDDGSIHSTLRKDVYNRDQSQTDIFEYDISRRCYDLMDPCGRIVFIKDTAAEGPGKGFWPVTGNYPAGSFERVSVEKKGKGVRLVNKSNDIKTTVDITLPVEGLHAEKWDVKVENLSGSDRPLKIIPYLEWVLNGPNDDRFHPQYSKLFPEVEYNSNANAVLAWQKKTKLMGFMALDSAPEGYLDYRLDFIGRARSVWDPEALSTLDFKRPSDSTGAPTFDPIGSMVLDAQVKARSVMNFTLVIGCAAGRDEALDAINSIISPAAGTTSPEPEAVKRERPFIGHGKIPPGTPLPYCEYRNNGDNMLVKSPYTPRPFDHQLCNALEHAVMVTNRGLHTTSNYNSQQNRITPDCSDIVTREIPGEAFYIYDTESGKWYSPTHHPLNDREASNQAEFSVEGTAEFRMKKGDLETELTVFVPPEDPCGIYMLKIKNNSDQPRRLRVSPYFQMVLGFMPEQGQPGSGSPSALTIKKDEDTGAVYYENPSNTFRKGPAFVAMTGNPEAVVTERGVFFGPGRAPERPYMTEKGSPCPEKTGDDRSVAALLKTVTVPSGGEESLAVIMGQAGEMETAREVVGRYRTVENVNEALETTRNWWRDLMSTVEIKTNQEEFDRLQNWLKYQDFVDRVWARRGFYQSSGAYGFRDQLQDTINIMWVDPMMARKQIILHASQQFPEGDVFHWFFTLPDGSTAFACRSHASDNLLWLVWGTVEYIKSTGDRTILDEMTSYVFSEDPFEPLPKNPHGIGGLYGRTTRSDTIYRHCLRSIDLVFDKKTGVNGLPLIGAGDWNDGLDEIGSQGKGESVWLGLFLYYILNEMTEIVGEKEGENRKRYYLDKQKQLKEAIERSWRQDRYLRAFHDDGTEIGVKGSGIWEIDALTAAWAVISGVNPERSEIMFNTAIDVLEKGNEVLLGWPALNEDSKPYLGRSCVYPEGVRENGMYCHGVQWMIKAARILAEKHEKSGNAEEAARYRETSYRLWRKITPVAHTTPEEIEVYGGQPNKQPADILTNFDPGRMIWNGYTGSGGWLFREAVEGVIGAELKKNKPVMPEDIEKPRGTLKVISVKRNLNKSPLK